MMIIDPIKGWFQTVKVLTFDLDEVTEGNDGYIDKLSVSLRQLFNNKWICGYLCPQKSFLTTDMSLYNISLL